MTSPPSSDLRTGAQALQEATANSHNRFNGGPNGATQRLQTRAPVGIKVCPKFKLTRADSIFTMGSCFARNVEHALVESGLRVLPEKFDFPLELLNPKAAELARASLNAPLHYRVIVRAVLNKYSPLSMLNEFQRVLEPERYTAPHKGLIQVDEDRWYDPQAKDTGMHGLKDSLTVRFLIEKATQEVRQTSAVFLTLGLTETWLDAETGTVLNFAPPPLLIKKWPDRFRFFNATYTDVLDSLEELYQLIVRKVRPDMKFVVTVSPVPLNTTFTAQDVITANTYSKSTLRAAADAFCARHDNADYFPSYEMVMSTHPDTAWKADRIHVTQDVVDFVIGQFIGAYIAPEPA
ncbi:MAG: GSCFA domain-containing protein [Rhodospirillaceae bacterium]|nr:GSCFA domain-containing protein [Rhodospirillaceae bacterium]